MMDGHTGNNVTTRHCLWFCRAMLSLLCIAASVSSAADVTWTNTTPAGATWHSDDNWDSTQPGPLDMAKLENGGKAIVTSDANITNLTLKAGSTLRLESGTLYIGDQGHDRLYLANSGGTSYVEQVGGTLHIVSGATYVGYNNANTFHGRFSSGTFIHTNGLAYAQTRFAQNSGIADVELSGDAHWILASLYMPYTGTPGGQCYFTVRDNAVLDLIANTCYFNAGTSARFQDNAVVNGKLLVGGWAPNQSQLLITGNSTVTGSISASGDASVIISNGTVSTSTWQCKGAGALISVRGGTVTATALQLGLSAGYTSTVEVVNNQTLTVNGGAIAARSGDVRVYLGNASSSGTLILTGDYTFNDGTYAPAGPSLLQGWGQLQCRYLKFNAYATNTCRLVADGYDTDRTLNIVLTGSDWPSRSLTSINGHGWYAQNKGKLVLPDLTVGAGSSVVMWGDKSAASTNELVNSVGLNFTGINGGTLSGALLAVDRSDLPYANGEWLAAWEFSGIDFGTGSAVLSFRYDDAEARGQGADEAALRVFRHNGVSWRDITDSLDTNAKQLTTTAITDLSLFAVGLTPPPLGAVIIVR